MSATLLRDGTRGDIARSARPLPCYIKRDGLYTSDGVFLNFLVVENESSSIHDVVHTVFNHPLSLLFINHINHFLYTVVACHTVVEIKQLGSTA